MKLLLKKERIPRETFNIWIIISVIVFASVISLSYLVASSVTAAQKTQQVSILNLECAAYAQQVNQILHSNSTACQFNANISARLNITNPCSPSSYYYCYYQQQLSANQIGCLCNGLTPDKLFVSGQLAEITLPSS